MKEFIFDPDGERLSLSVFFGQAQVGSYNLRLWESGSNTIVMEENGNNQNPDDDTYELPMPTSKNDGRLVQCQTTIVAPDLKPGDRYYVALKFRQGNAPEQKLEDEGPMNDKQVHPELIARLRAQ